MLARTHTHTHAEQKCAAVRFHNPLLCQATPDSLGSRRVHLDVHFLSDGFLFYPTWLLYYLFCCLGSFVMTVFMFTSMKTDCVKFVKADGRFYLILFFYVVPTLSPLFVFFTVVMRGRSFSASLTGVNSTGFRAEVTLGFLINIREGSSVPNHVRSSPWLLRHSRPTTRSEKET